MDILKILKESGEDLYLEDLDFFETELAVSDEYSDDYRTECENLIRQRRTWLKPKANDEEEKEDNSPHRKKPSPVRVRITDLAPQANNPATESLTPAQLIHRDIVAMRDSDSYKSEFKDYVKKNSKIDASFIDMHFSIFQPWELGAIISVRQMPEEFLEKYFGALDRDKIARYQKFSEEFFMKHFSQLDTEIVLLHGKNEWRKKENRSKQLDVFLRLKGVKI